MKICILGPAVPYRGGISLFAMHLGKTFRELGHEVLFSSFKRQYPDLLFPGKEQTDETLNSDGFMVQRILTAWLPWTWESAVQAIRGFKPDLIIVSWFLPFFAPAYGYILKRLNTRKMILAHNVSAHEKWAFADWLTSFVFGSADRIVVLSKATLHELDTIVPLRIARKAVLGFHPIYAYTSSSVQAAASNEPDKTLLFFGLIKPYKGLDILLDAMPMVIKAIPEIKLVIAGEIYGDPSVYEEQIKALGIGQSVDCQFHYISETEIAGLFSKASICVLPYRSASQSGVIATSYSFGVPVLATKVGGLSEYIEEGKTGYLVEPNSPAELAKAILKHFEAAPDLKPGIKEYCQRFSWQSLAGLFLEP